MQCGGLLLTANSDPYAKSIGIDATFITLALTAQNYAMVEVVFFGDGFLTL